MTFLELLTKNFEAISSGERVHFLILNHPAILFQHDVLFF